MATVRSNILKPNPVTLTPPTGVVVYKLYTNRNRGIYNYYNVNNFKKLKNNPLTRKPITPGNYEQIVVKNRAAPILRKMHIITRTPAVRKKINTVHNILGGNLRNAEAYVLSNKFKKLDNTTFRRLFNERNKAASTIQKVFKVSPRPVRSLYKQLSSMYQMFGEKNVKDKIRKMSYNNISNQIGNVNINTYHKLMKVLKK